MLNKRNKKLVWLMNNKYDKLNVYDNVLFEHHNS